MSFISFSYILFLIIVFVLYWWIKPEHRWIVILLFSYYFYMSWNVKYVLLIFFTTFVSYAFALIIENTNEKKYRKLILLGNIVILMGILFIFKYFNFISVSVCNMLSSFSIQLHPITLQLLLPVGISFYTFQTVSYVIDVYNGQTSAERHFGKYAAFISFFPQLVAGPIERSKNLLPQIVESRNFDYYMAVNGLRQMLLGCFKKVVIADMLAVYVDKVYSGVSNYTGGALFIAALFFSIQIYCDFSGYSDIAIGSAKLFGIKLSTNFNKPYWSYSVKDFWGKWHISLSSWFKDYVYIPLGGNRCSLLRNQINILITFLLSGLWHGANWTFVLWGGIHGLAQVFENLIGGSKRKNSANKSIWNCINTFVFISFAWIFFRADTFFDAIYVISNMFVGIDNLRKYFFDMLVLLDMSKRTLFKIFILIVGLFFYEKNMSALKKLFENKIIRWFIYYFAIALIVIGYLDTMGENQFVYFQF